MRSTSLLGYYRDNQINPVPIPLQDDAAWQTHVAKRRHLYERHLGIPFSLLRGCSVLEFGCNSGENALVLASMGANLTLVEPNPHAVQPLLDLFSTFGLRERVTQIVQESIEEFEAQRKYDLVIAEGFLNHLEHRDQMLVKVCRLTVPGGLAVISYDDRVGHFLELLRKLLFWRAYRLEGLTDVRCAQAIDLAKRLFSEDFNRLNASRTFEGWYDDVLVNPFVASEYLWSYDEIIPLIEQADCEFQSSSPVWSSVDRFTWYKNVLDVKDHHQQIIAEWPQAFSYFLTGLRPGQGYSKPAAPEIVDSLLDWTGRISEFIQNPTERVSSVSYPAVLDGYLSDCGDPKLGLFNDELKSVTLAIQTNVATDLIETYQGTTCLRHLWGAPYHYVCMRKAQ